MLPNRCAFLTQNDVISCGIVRFEMAEPLLFCHPVRDHLTLKVLVNLEVKGFLRDDKIKVCQQTVLPLANQATACFSLRRSSANGLT